MAHANIGRFVWYDLLVPDVKAAIAFYTEVVGWKSQPFGDSQYTMWVGEQGPMGGVMDLPAEAKTMGAPPHWIGNVQIESVEASVALVKKLGGKVYKEPADIPTVGRFAVVADPQGGSIALFQPSMAMALHDTGKPGEVCWNELMTTDRGAAFKFYSEVFGWKSIQEMDMGPMGVYQIFGIGDVQLGGIMTKPKDAPMPTAWRYYVEVPELDSAIARATQRGAKVLNGPMDVPGGRVANLMDPQGAAISLHKRAG
jgi:uncharacterized protein